MFRKVFVKDSSFSISSPPVVRLLVLVMAALLVSQTVGCAGWGKLYEDSVIKYRDLVWAKRAYNLRYEDCQRDYSQHFENGFQAGYQSASNGGDGYVPALPPKAYRSYEYQSADGARCVNSWFEGYPAGVAAAKKDQSGTYHDVLISRMIDSAVQQERLKTFLPDDIPVVVASNASNQDASMTPPLPNGWLRADENGTLGPDVDSTQFRQNSTTPRQALVIPTGFQEPVQENSLNQANDSWKSWDIPR